MFDTTIIIDDDPISILVGETMLRKTSFCKTIESIDNARDALVHLEKRYLSGLGLPDFIFLDVRMPGMDGWEFLDQYSQMKSLPSRVPHVIVLSAAFEKNDMNRAKNCDLVLEALVKPLSQEILSRLLSKS